MHTYYFISSEKLGEGSKIPLAFPGNSDAVFTEMAQEMVTTIECNNAIRKPTVFICPVGPVGQYPIFVKLVNQERLSLKNCWFFNMDEYLQDDGSYIPMDSPLSFRGFMERTVYSQIDPELVVPPQQRIFPDPADPAKLDRLLLELGGADICFGGIGINGHLAFNEASDDLPADEFAQLGTRVLAISRETRTANAIGDLGGAIDAMPKLCVTIVMAQILSAKKVRLGVFRDWHRAVVRQAAYGEVTAHFPVSLLQNHPDALIYVNNNAAIQPFAETR